MKRDTRNRLLMIVGFIPLGIVTIIAADAWKTRELDPNRESARLVDSCDKIEIWSFSLLVEAALLDTVRGEATRQFSAMLAGLPKRRDVIDTCGCMGNPHIRFFHDGEQIGELAIHHGERITFRSGKFKGQTFRLERESKSAILGYLSSLPIDEFSRANESSINACTESAVTDAPATR